MLKGINLTLMIGPAIPVPVPQVVLDALTAIEVTTSSGSTQSGFKLTFTLSTHSPLHTIFLLGGASPIPIIRVLLVVTLNGVPDVLIDGIMSRHQVTPGSDAGHSVLTVYGDDLTALMNYIDFSGLPYPAMPVEARVAVILSKYLAFGIVPLIIPSVFPDVPLPVEQIPRQQGKDYEYLVQMAQSVGYVFYLETTPVPGVSIAYWGPLIKVGIPQPALNTNMDAHTNVEQLSFSFDNAAKTLPVLFIKTTLLKVPIPIPIPDVSLLNPPLGLIPPIPHNIEPITGMAKLSFAQAALFGLKQSAQSSDAVTGQGSLDVLRYGRILKARQLVGVRGVGMAFDGLYYVESVTHSIKRGEYKQSFNLSRNGLVSTVPVVPS